MKKVRTYEKFSDEYRLNENLFKRAWSAIVKFFIDVQTCMVILYGMA